MQTSQRHLTSYSTPFFQIRTMRQEQSALLQQGQPVSWPLVSCRRMLSLKMTNFSVGGIGLAVNHAKMLVMEMSSVAGMRRELQKVKQPFYVPCFLMRYSFRGHVDLLINHLSVVGSLGYGKALSLAQLFYVAHLVLSKLFCSHAVNIFSQYKENKRNCILCLVKDLGANKECSRGNGLYSELNICFLVASNSGGQTGIQLSSNCSFRFVVYSYRAGYTNMTQKLSLKVVNKRIQRKL